MVTRANEWDTHPDNITPAVPNGSGFPVIPCITATLSVAAQLAIPTFAGTSGTPAIIRARSTMICPPSAVANNAVDNFNRAWLTFDKKMEAETKLSAAIILSLGSLTSASVDRMAGISGGIGFLKPVDLVDHIYITTLYCTPTKADVALLSTCR
jgi:hypothetical protein